MKLITNYIIAYNLHNIIYHTPSKIIDNYYLVFGKRKQKQSENQIILSRIKCLKFILLLLL